MMEYAIFIAMVIVTIGFAWLWLIEQQKKRKRNEARRKNEIEKRLSHSGASRRQKAVKLGIRLGHRR